MTKINFTGTSPVYFPVSFQGRSGVVYGLNVFPGEQSIEDDAWAEMQKDSLALSHIQGGTLALALPEAVEVPEETAPAAPEGEATGLHEGSGEESKPEGEGSVDPAPEGTGEAPGAPAEGQTETVETPAPATEETAPAAPEAKA